MKKRNMRGTVTVMCLAMLTAVILMVTAIWQRNTLKARLAEVRTELETSQTAGQQLAADKTTLETERDQLTADLQAAQTSLAEAATQNEALTARIAELETGNAALQAEVSQKNGDLTAAQAALAEVETLSTALEAAQTNADALRTELIASLRTYRAYLSDELQATRVRLSKMTTGAFADPSDIDAAWAEEARLSGEVSALDIRIAVLEAAQ